MKELTAYIDGWRRHDISAVLAMLADDCLVIECYGPVYRGRHRVEQWMRAWLGEGESVDDWRVTDVVEIDDFQFAEWRLTSAWRGKQDTFDGATFAKIVEGNMQQQHRCTSGQASGANSLPCLITSS